MLTKQYQLNSGFAVLAIALAIFMLWPGLLPNLLVSTGFMPHGHCYLWKPQLVWLHVASDILIGLSYVSISATLVYLVAKARESMPFSWVFVAFGLFIVACGATHFMEVWTLWTPLYWLAGEVKLITAIASVTTAILLFPLVPQVQKIIIDAKVSGERKLKLESAIQELQILNQKLKEIDHQKSEFFTRVSHELRTPLTLILGPTEKLINSNELTETQQQAVRVIARNAQTLLKHVNDLLDIAKLEVDKMGLNYSEVDLVPLVRVTVGNFETLAQDSEISLTLDTPASLKAQVDPEKLQRVLLNLFSNAFKFTPNGGKIRCALESSSEEGENQNCIITIADSGSGIPAELRDIVFEPFRQLEDVTTRRVGGTGLGLAIAKEFVELHQGTITVSDAPEGGALFTIKIPLTAPRHSILISSPISPHHIQEVTQQLIYEIQPQASIVNASGSAPDNPESPLVLIVEDNPDMNGFIAQTLASEYRVVTANNGKEGLEKALELCPDLIVSDLMMPFVSGDQLVQQARQYPKLQNTPIILLTAKADDNLRVQLLRQGVQDYLTKPFRAEELQARVANLVTIKRTREVLQQELFTQSQDITALANEVALRKQDLQRLASELEVRVEQRTAELAETNEMLIQEVAGRRIAQSQLEQSLSLLGATLEATADGILVVNQAGKIVSFNQKFLDLWHLTESLLTEQKQSRTLALILLQLKNPKEYLQKIKQLYQQPEAGYNGILEFLDRRVYELYSLPQIIAGKIVGRVFSFRDVTQRHQAEQELKTSESTLRSFYNSTSMMMGVVALADDDILHISDNAASAQFFGLAPSEMQYHFASELGVKPTYLQKWLTYYQQSAQTKSPVRFEYLHENSHKQSWLAVTVSAIESYEHEHQEKHSYKQPKINNLSPQRFAYVIEDITERKQVEQRLRLLESVAVHAHDAILITEAEPLCEPGPKIIYVNQAFTQMTGYTEAEVLGKTPRILQGAKSDRAALDKLSLALQNWQSTVIEVINYRKDGSEFWVEISIVPVADETGWYTHWVAVQRDITERKLAEQALYRSEQEFRALVENSPDIILRLDQQYRHLYVNPATENCYGIPKQTFIGKSYQDFLSSAKLIPLWEKALAEVFTAGNQQEIEFQSTSTEGLRYYQSRIVPEFGQQGTIESALVVSRDITQIKQAQEEIRHLNSDLEKRVKERTAQLESANQKLEELNRMKDEFLAIVSHELRTPLNSILGWASMLRSRKLDETTTNRALETIERNAKSQTQLIEDLLDVSRMMRGKISLHTVPVDLSLVIKAALEAIIPTAKSKSIQLESTVETKLGLVSGDANRLQQVMGNLLANAVKFTPEGGKIEVKLSLVDQVGESNQPTKYAQIQIQDTGAGISSDFLPFVFERFRQADASTTRSYGGLGLGLAIVRNLVELHGGTVQADSAGLGMGATFTVRLPIMESAQGESNARVPETFLSPIASRLSPLKGVWALVVAQNQEQQEFLSNTLVEYGAKVTQVSAVESVCSLIEELLPDVLVTCIDTPSQDAYSLIQQVRSSSSEKVSSIPAIAIASESSQEERQAFLEAGFQKYLANSSVKPAQIVAAIAILVGRIKKL